jgi:hypothetical protein
MKGKLVSVVTMFIIGALLMSTLGFIRPALATYRIYMDPSVNNFSNGAVGTTFDVTVKVDDVPSPGAAAFQVYVEFNDDQLNVTKWVEPTADAAYLFNGKTTSANPTPPNPGYVHIALHKGRIQVAANEFPTPPAQTPVFGAGPYKLCVLTFIIIAAPAKLGSLSSVLHFGPADTYLLDSDGLNLGQPALEDGSYSNTWVTPANVNLDMNPATVTLDEWNWHIGETFNVQFRLTSLALAWELSSASFDVRFDEYVVDVVGGLADVTFDPIWGTTSATFDYSVLNNAKMSISVSNPSSIPSGTVITATVKFTVIHQNDFLITPVDLTTTLTYESVLLYDHVGTVNVGTLGTCVVTVKAKKPANLPWMEVVPTSVVLGPDPSIGEEFDIGIKLTGPPPEKVPGMSHIVGAQFRLFFDDTIITPVGITEGSFFQDPTWNLYGTFFYGTYETDGLGPHVLVGTLLLPNGSSGLWDQTTFPNGEGMIATIRFKALVQECPNSFECDLTLGSVFGEWLINKDGEYVMMNETAIVNGHYEMLPFDTPGRVIDIYGGAVNDGYGVLVGSPYLQFPVPYGGQGPNHWMDIVFPQSQIFLNAYVTYNYWPVQSKDVGWEIEGPYTKLPNGTLVKGQRWQIWDKETSTTDANGIATLTFRMPWPCEDPDGITGIWKITGTGIVGDVQINDVIIFYYERLVYITSVTTDKYYYIHTEYVKVTVDYETHAVQIYPALFSIVIKDDLLVPFGMALYATTVGGATFCTWKTDEFEVEIFIPKWAYAGYGHVHVNCYDKDPTDGGFAWVQEYTPLPEIQIGPY